ncbi:MAG: Ig-like domain-containing protein [Saprospiraceae bacterium]
MGKIRYLISFFLSASLLYSCANQASLGGGPKDVTPPKIDSLKSTPNFKTNFKPKEIKFFFDEWISLKNQNQILISPPLEKNLKFTQRGKHILIEIPEEDTLLENTTYCINFGKSIVDYTEGNPLQENTFLFSTGDYIDSLEISGKITDAYDNTPLKDVLVMLYKSNEDSIVIKSKPYYFSTTKEDGTYKIPYIKESDYKIFALKDENSNYLFDNEKEKIGYLDSMIHIDTSKQFIQLQLFQPNPSLYINTKQISDYGKVEIKFNTTPDSIELINSSAPVILEELDAENLTFWLQNSVDSINLILKYNDKIDTLELKTTKELKKPGKYKALKVSTEKSMFPEKEITLLFDSPISAFDTSCIEISDTIEKYRNFNIYPDSVNHRKLWLKKIWKEEHEYNITFLPGAFTGLYEQINDTIKNTLKTGKLEDFSTLICNFDSINPENQYIVNLISNKKEVDKFIINNTSNFQKKLSGLPPGKYSLEIILDENKNGRWDSGDYFKKTYPEKVIRAELSELKINWEQQENINLNQSVFKK